jgi:hypothetical protein
MSRRDRFWRTNYLRESAVTLPSRAAEVDEPASITMYERYSLPNPEPFQRTEEPAGGKSPWIIGQISSVELRPQR